MKWLKKLLNTPYISWRLIEWLIIFSKFTTIIFFGNNYKIRPERIQLEIIFAILFWLLSLIFPVNLSNWEKRIYIAIELILINYALSFGIGFDTLMYFILAKACFLLKRKDAIAAIVITGISTIVIYANILPQFQAEAREYIRLNGTEVIFDSLGEELLSGLVEYIAISFFLTLFMFLLVDKARNEKVLVFITLMESKSRKRAEQLTQDIKALTTVMERNRIARDIHDSLGHTLTTLGVQLELAQKLQTIDSQKATQALNNARKLATQSLADVRNTVTTIRDEDFDLTKALNTLCDRFRQDKIFEIQLQLNLPPIPLQTSHQIYCIVKEALYNIQKHSKADLVIIKNEIEENNIIIKIIDNGIGFESQQITSGMGIKGMIERAKMINAQLVIDPAIGKGTIVCLIVNT